MSNLDTQETEEQLLMLKNALLSLKPAGAEGFEGLVRIVLSKLTGIPFRLAASGFQGGMDGDSALRSDAVSFEAKRYSGNIHRKEVLIKIADLSRNDNSPDRLWVLGATTEISSQLASDVRQDGNNNSISTLILDWTATPLPLLAVATVAADEAAIDFLIQHFEVKENPNKYNRKELVEAFKIISEHAEFNNTLLRLKAGFNVSKLAAARSITLNKVWRRASFEVTEIARERLGQALAVLAQPNLPSLRVALREQVRGELENGRNIILLGDEGQGKSWLAAQICHSHEGIALFASAERFEGTAPKDLDKFLIDLFIEQTSDVAEETIKRRWCHRLFAWQRMPPESAVLVIVDGINQRQSLRWDRLLNSLQNRLKAIGGQLIVTVRPQYWQKEVAAGLTFKPRLIQVPEWTPDERDQLLKHYGIKLDWLDNATLQTLRNPRLLGVAVTTLPREQSSAWIGLTTDRLLMEHLRTSQRENFENETFRELTKRLSVHAEQVLKRVQESSNEPPRNFEKDSLAVIETRFFQMLDGPGNTYELREEGLTLALGYALVDQLWQGTRSDIDLIEQITHFIDPIRAMDRTVDIVFASLMICTLDANRFHGTIFASLLDAFSSLQNINDQRIERFIEIVRHQPTELFRTLGDFCLERGWRINQDWFNRAAFAIAGTDEGWQVAEPAIHGWLHCYDKDAIRQSNRYSKNNDAEDEKRLQKTQGEIKEVLLSLSPFEEDMLGRMTEVSGEIDSLFTLALQLLAGRPLASFAGSFVALGLGFALDTRVHSAHKAFWQLTTFNKVDREATKDAFLRAIEPLKSPETSRAGQWTIVRMLFATGDEAATADASELVKKLREDQLHWEPPAADEWRQAKVADPNAARPYASGVTALPKIEILP